MTVIVASKATGSPAALTRAEQARARQPLGPIVFLAAVLAIALSGGALVVIMAVWGNATADLRRGSPIATSIPTDFGYLTVPYVEKLDGLTSKDLSGGAHGVSGLVKAGNEQIQVELELSSILRDKVTPYRVDEFSLLVGDGTKSLAPSSTTIHNGVLQPNSAVNGHLGFVVPKDGSRLRLRYAPQDGHSVLVELGRADQARPGETNHDH
jgi:hypothetical protein